MKYIFGISIVLLMLLTGCSSKNTVMTNNKDQNNFSKNQNINETDFIGDMAIHDAVRSVNIENVKQLIDKKIELNSKNKYGYTPLHIAVRYNALEIVTLLFENGANLNTVDKFGDTPLIDSTRNKYTKISEFLICKGANKDVMDVHKMTPLHYTVKNNDLDISSMLNSTDLNSYCNKKEKIVEKTPGIVEEVIETPVLKNETIIEENPSLNKIEDKDIIASDDKVISLYEALNNEFENDFSTWNAELNKETLSISFKSKQMFEHGSNLLTTFHQDILSNFYPRYVNVLKIYTSQIGNIFVEGHTSSVYKMAKNDKERFDFNMKLSQNRAEKVVEYVSNLKNEVVIENLSWINKIMKPVGKSSLESITNEDGTENEDLSRRVEFRIQTVTE